MISDLAITAITRLIDIIDHSRTTQNQSDKLYDDLCYTIINEMEKVIPKFDCTEKTPQKIKYHKPYWNEELTSLWKTMRENEKQFLKTKSNHRDNRELLRIYKLSQNSLDKRIRYYERRWRRGVALELDEISVRDPRKFWDKIKHSGPKKKQNLPMNVIWTMAR